VALKIGTSGWQYDHWRRSFYPEGVPKSRWLEYYAERFATVESNSAFYRLPERRVFADWAQRTPPDFEVAVKASRYLTHIRRLKEPEEAVTRLAERLEGLGEKCGPVLLQLPPNLPVDRVSLERTLRAFPAGTRIAFEARHPSWFDDAVRRLLEGRGVAWCLTDTGGRISPLWRTAAWGYVRFHRGRAWPPPCYGRQAIRTWADRLAGLFGPECDVYCYFNNDTRACALRDAHRMALAATRVGLVPTRTAPTAEITLDESTPAGEGASAPSVQ
jgi:uncharacterized protein YecE (DUF72 family)